MDMSMEESFQIKSHGRRSLQTLEAMLEGGSPMVREQQMSKTFKRRSATLNVQKSLKLLDESVASPVALGARTPGGTLRHSSYTPRQLSSASKFDISSRGATPKRIPVVRRSLPSAGKLSHTLSRSLLFFNVLTLCLLLVLLVLTTAWFARLADPEETEQMICEPCSHNTIPESCKVKETGDCCCKTTEVIDALTKKATKEKFNNYHSLATASVIKLDPVCEYTQRISGKVSRIDYIALQSDKREKDLVYWEESENSLHNSVRFTNGRFIIIQPGYYYVFSQIKYDHYPNSAGNSRSRQSHSLHLYSLRTREQKLLESVRTFAELSSPENNGTSFIGADFRFEEHDEIMIKSSHTGRISGTDTENFFGLYII